MTATEAEILKELRITHAEVADILGGTRQAVSRGLSNEKIGYLNSDRLRQLYRRLRSSRPDTAEKFKLAAIANLGVEDDLFYEGPEYIDNQPKLTDDFEELWIFSSRPREVLERSYLHRMRRFLELPSNNSNRRIVYFVPTDVVSILQTLIENEIAGIPREKRSHVQIVETSSVLYSPHFVIFNPRSDNASGMVAIAEKAKMAKLHNRQTNLILDALFRNGIGVHDDEIVIETHHDGAAGQFKKVFDTHETDSRSENAI